MTRNEILALIQQKTGAADEQAAYNVLRRMGSYCGLHESRKYLTPESFDSLENGFLDPGLPDEIWQEEYRKSQLTQAERTTEWLALAGYRILACDDGYCYQQSSGRSPKTYPTYESAVDAAIDHHNMLGDADNG